MKKLFLALICLFTGPALAVPPPTNVQMANGSARAVTPAAIIDGNGDIVTTFGGGSASAPSDVQGSGALAASSVGSTYTVPVSAGQNTATFYLSGLTASGATVVVEGTNDGTNWNAVYATRSPDGALLNAFTADGGLGVNIAGRRGVRVRVSVAGTGSIAAVSTLSVAVREVRLDSALPAGTNGIGSVSVSNTSIPVTVANGADTATGGTGDAAYTGSGAATVVGLLKGSYAAQTAPTPAGTNTIGNVGLVTSTGTAITGNTNTLALIGTGVALNVNSLARWYDGGNFITAPGTTNGGAMFMALDNTSAGGASATTVYASAGNTFKGSAGNVATLSLVNSTSAGFVVLVNVNAVPASGATITAATNRYCMPVPASAGFDKSFNVPLYFSAGITALLSTSCTVYTPVSAAPVQITVQFK